MNIYEFADVIDKEIVIRRYPNQGGRFIAEFEGSGVKETKQDCMLTSTYGDDFSLETALVDYIDRIRGKIIVFNSHDSDRQEFVIPGYITAK